MPSVSWLIPVHNGSPYLDVALQSVSAQTIGDFEALVVDDGSEDGSIELIRAHCRADSRFRLVEKPHSGIVDTLNLGLAHCTGGYLARMDSDDICEPHRLERQIAHLDANPGCVAVGSRVTVIDEAGRVLHRTRGRALRPAGPDGFPPEKIVLTHPSVVGRTDAFRHAGGYRQGFPAAEDYDLWFRMRHLGGVVELPEHLLRYRVHPASESGRKVAIQSFSCLKAEVVEHLVRNDAVAGTFAAILDCKTLEALLSLTTRMCDLLPTSHALEAYYWAEYLRRATNRLGWDASRGAAYQTLIRTLRLAPGLGSRQTQFFMRRGMLELARWAVTSALGRGRPSAGHRARGAWFAKNPKSR